MTDTLNHLAKVRAGIKELRDLEGQLKTRALDELREVGGTHRFNNGSIATVGRGPRAWNQDLVKETYPELWHRSLKPPALDVQALKSVCLAKNVDFAEVADTCSVDGTERVVIRRP